MNKLSAYNFLAQYLGSNVFSSEIELDNAIELNEADKRCIPSYWYSVFNIDTQQVIATLWTSRNGFEIFKTVDNVITEHYRRPRGTENLFVSLDLISHEITEYYRMVGVDLVKFDINTNERLGHTTDCTFDTLPQEYQAKLASHPNKDSLVYWADKPYGRVVGIIESK